MWLYTVSHSANAGGPGAAQPAQTKEETPCLYRFRWVRAKSHPKCFEKVLSVRVREQGQNDEEIRLW